MTHSQADLILGMCGSIGRIEVGTTPVGIVGLLKIFDVLRFERGTIVKELRFSTLVEFDDETIVRSAEFHFVGKSHCGKEAQEQEGVFFHRGWGVV